MSRPIRVTRRNAAFQHWQSLLTNRMKRMRSGEFLVHGVRPITMAVQQGWAIRTLLHDGRATPSSWAQELLSTVAADRVTLAPDLLHELGQKSDGTPELLAVVEMPPDGCDRIPRTDNPVVVVFDRPSSPGNIGTLVRSVDAFGGTALVVTGHAADPYDPKCVRASTGSLFSVPVIRAQSHLEVLDWVARERARGIGVVVFGTDEAGDTDIRGAALTYPAVVVVGNETAGMTSAWRQACEVTVRIPMTGMASSLNAAAAGSILMYEVMRQRAPRPEFVDPLGTDA